ncbi:outer membrane lipoprotein-sorting protein, partial [bacterium]|nr:outer membrane lipoprotein-sorting protein [bacterium]
MRFLLHLCYLFFLLYAPLTFGSTPSVDDILQKADEVRNPSQSYSMKVRVLRGEAKEFTSSFEVFIQGNQKTLIRTLEPNRDRGRNLLMLGEEMWAFIPNLNRSVRVSLSQKLTGEAANGDLSRMRWSGDYSAVIEKQGAEQWTLLLTARKK